MPGMIEKAKAKKEAQQKKPAAPEVPEKAPAPAVPEPGGQVTSEEPASDEEQQSYEEAIKMLYKMMYVDDKTSATVVDMLQPGAKVDSIVKASVLIIQQIDEKLDLEAAVIPQLVMEVPDMLIELAERAKQMTFSDGELKAILGSTQEMVMQVIDVDAGEARRLMDSISPEQKAQAERDYNQMLSEASDDSQQSVRPEQGQQGVPSAGSSGGAAASPVQGSDPAAAEAVAAGDDIPEEEVMA